jgi:simple sugar transport system permease protein
LADFARLSGIVFSIYTLPDIRLPWSASSSVQSLPWSDETLLMGGAGFVGGTLIGIFVQGLILTYIAFDGMLSSCGERRY